MLYVSTRRERDSAGQRLYPCGQSVGRTPVNSVHAAVGPLDSTFQRRNCWRVKGLRVRVPPSRPGLTMQDSRSCPVSAYGSTNRDRAQPVCLRRVASGRRVNSGRLVRRPSGNAFQPWTRRSGDRHATSVPGCRRQRTPSAIDRGPKASRPSAATLATNLDAGRAPGSRQSAGMSPTSSSAVWLPGTGRLLRTVGGLVLGAYDRSGELGKER
jgi:hypothetical protein